MNHVIRGLTFDFWSTLYAPVREPGQGALPLRLASLRRLLAGYGQDPGDAGIRDAFQLGERAFDAAWLRGDPFTARDRVEAILKGLKLPSREALVETAVEELEAAGRSPLPLAPGVKEAIPRLSAAGYRLGVVSDAATTPGRILREFLVNDGLMAFLAPNALSFSDETGHCKPRPQAFQAALTGLGLAAQEVAHVGDIPRTDVAGAQAVGMKAIRYAGVDDRPGDPLADAVIYDHRELLDLLPLL